MASPLEQYRQIYEQAKKLANGNKTTTTKKTTSKPKTTTTKTAAETTQTATPVAQTVATPTQTYATPTYATNYSQSLFDYFKEKNEKARQSSLDAIMSKLKLGEQQYNTNINNITEQYNALRNQSEVERYKTQRMMREALANKGQLDSGFGRQEQLLMDTQYGNAINSLNSQEAKAKGEVKNLIAQLRAEAELEKANINNQYNAAIEQYKSQMGS